MSDAGYTLVETLAAMAVVGLALGGLSLGMQVLGPSHLATSQAIAALDSARNAETRFEGLLARGAPYGSGSGAPLTGDGKALTFGCGRAKPCRAELAADGPALAFRIYDGQSDTPVQTLRAPDGARLTYGGQWTTSAIWPPADPRRQALRSIALIKAAAADAPPLIEARIWGEEPAVCAFDPVMQDCRAP